jgi:hypothetical protein
MITSYLLSSTLVPVLATWVLKGPKELKDAETETRHHQPAAQTRGGSEEWMQKGLFGRHRPSPSIDLDATAFPQMRQALTAATLLRLTTTRLG